MGDAMAGHHPRHRRRHDQHAGDAVRGRRRLPRLARSEDLDQHYPRPGWVEHDRRGDLAEDARLRARRWSPRPAGRSGSPAIGITNQRETIVFWSRRTGRALGAGDRLAGPAHRRALRRRSRSRATSRRCRRSTGLLLDPYFSASKIAWAMAEWPQLREAGDDLAHRHGRELAGLAADRRPPRLGRDQRLAHRPDGHSLGPLGRGAARPVRRAGRGAARDRRLRRRATATPTPSCSARPIPICGMAGDQQAAAIGQACLARRRHQGDLRHRRLRAHPYRRDRRRSRATACSARSPGSSAASARYALEGSVFVAGSLVKWLRDELGLIASAAETEALAALDRRQRRRHHRAGPLRARRAALAARGARRRSPA